MSQQISVGTLILFDHQRDLILGMVVSVNPRGFQIFTEKGTSIELPRERLVVLPEMPNDIPLSSEDRATFLTDLHEKARVVAQQLTVLELWKRSSSAPKPFSLPELAKLLGGQPSTVTCIALFFALTTDRVFFNRAGELFEPRTKDGVEQLQSLQKQKSERAALSDEFAQWILLRLANPKDTAPLARTGPLRLLEDLAGDSQTVEPERQRQALELLEYLRPKLSFQLTNAPAKAAIDLLDRAGITNRNTNLARFRYRWPTAFSDAAQKAASEVPSIEAIVATEKKIRRDLTSLACFTVDDISTLDMDDAISLEELGDGFRVGIHISDVAAIVRGGGVEKDAKKRATSLYLAEETVPMLPRDLSERHCSLVAGNNRLATTCMFEISHNGEVKNTEIFPSIVNISERLTYHAVDALLEKGDRRWDILQQLSHAHGARRSEAGAVNGSKNEAYVVIRGEDEFELIQLDEGGPARNLIGELMVMANAAFAQFAFRNRIPFIYRTQDAAEEEETGGVESARPQFKKSSFSTSPRSHASLGLSLYTQMTSPIRRYIDLANQSQLLSFWRTGTPERTRDDMQEIIEKVEEPLSRANFLSRESKRFWIYRYLEERFKKEGPLEYMARVIKTGGKATMVELDQIFIAIPVRSLQNSKVGEGYKIKILEVNARNNQLRVEIIS